MADASILLARAAAALHGVTLGHDDLQRLLADAAARPGGVAELVEHHASPAQLALDNRALAHRVVANLGLAPVLQHTGEQLLRQAFDAAGAQRGRALLDVLQGLADAAASPSVALADEADLFIRRIDHAVSHGAQAGSATVAYRDGGTRALTAATDAHLDTGLLDHVYTGVVTGALRTYQADDRMWSGAARERLHLVVDGAAGEIELGGASAPLRIDVEARPDAAGAALPVRLTATLGFLPQRLDFLRSEVDAQLRVHTDPDTLPRLTFGVVDSAPGVDHEIRVWGLGDVAAQPGLLQLEMIDVAAAASAIPARASLPLADLHVRSVSFQLSGTPIVLADRAADAGRPGSLSQARTVDELLQAVQRLLRDPDSLRQHDGLAQVTAEEGPAFQARDPASGTWVQGTSIVLKTAAGSGLSLQSGSFQHDAAAAAAVHLQQHVVAPAEWTEPIVHVVLDHAGRGGIGGALRVGTPTDDPYGGGLSRLMLTVERDSALSHIEGVNGMLDELVVRSGGVAGRLQVLGGDEVLSPASASSLAFGLLDLRRMDLSGFDGASQLDVRVRAPAWDRFRTDPQLVTEGVHYTGGRGADDWAVVVDGVGARRGDVTLHLDGGAGDDRLHVVVQAAGSTVPAVARVVVEGGAGHDRLQLATGSVPVVVRFGDDFGADRIRGFDGDDRFDFSAIGGLYRAATLASEPAALSLGVVPGGVTVAPMGAGTDDAEGVAMRFWGSASTKAASQLYIAWDGTQTGHVWRVDDPAGAAIPSARLIGTITLEDGAGWAQLPAAAFGG